ncbi:conjugal transfer protein [Enterococcus asini]|nr:conjugal transfer protein [Enterococcus asini]
MHGSHVAVPIACDASNARTMAVREYHYHDKKVMAGNPAKDCLRSFNMNRSLPS